MNRELELEINNAMEFCIKAHAGQFRRDGVTPYHTHPMAVAEMVPDELKPAALLHDVLEDCGITPAYLEQVGFSERTIKAVVWLTRIKGEDYDNYIEMLTFHPDAVHIKIADIEHNLSCNPSENSRKKTAKWLPVLKSKLDGEKL